MRKLAQLVAELVTNRDDDLDLEMDVLGTDDPDVIARAIVGFLEERVGRVAESLFYRHSVGIAVGSRLADGRSVVLKVHRWNASVRRLSAIQMVQSRLADARLPVPRPLGVAPIGAGIATIEELLPGGVADGHDPEVRHVLAAELWRFVDGARTLNGTPGLEHPVLLRPPGAPLWPEPHMSHYDFAATAEGAQWIDALAEEARRRLGDAQADDVVGHFDWRVSNVGFSGHRLVAIYDWDSVAVAPEQVVVGCAAGGFSADWSRPGGAVPELEEMRAFVSDYESARQRPFTGAERELLDAANLAQIAYGARCQWSDHVLFPDSAKPVTKSWIGLLDERGSRGIR